MSRARTGCPAAADGAAAASSASSVSVSRRSASVAAVATASPCGGGAGADVRVRLSIRKIVASSLAFVWSFGRVGRRRRPARFAVTRAAARRLYSFLASSASRVFGDYEGKLSSSDDEVSLKDAAGTVV